MSGLIEEFISRHPCKPTVAARLRRLNPNLKECMMVRGLYRKPLSWRRAKIRMRRNGHCQAPYRAPWGGTLSPFVLDASTLPEIAAHRCASCRKWIKKPLDGIEVFDGGLRQRWHARCYDHLAAEAREAQRCAA